MASSPGSVIGLSDASMLTPGSTRVTPGVTSSATSGGGGNSQNLQGRSVSFDGAQGQEGRSGFSGGGASGGGAEGGERLGSVEGGSPGASTMASLSPGKPCLCPSRFRLADLLKLGSLRKLL